MKISTDEELNRFSISVHDFDDSQKFLSESFKYECGSIVQEALLIAAIIYFARPFSFNERDKQPKAIPNLKIDWFSEITQDELDLFITLIDIRNKCLAHAEYTYYPSSIDHATGVLRGRRYSACNSPINVQLFQSLLEKLIEQSHNKRADYSAAIKRKNR